MIRNVILQEAAERTGAKPDSAVAAVKKSMNIIKLSKYKSADECSKLYSMLFLCTYEDTELNSLTVEQLGVVYSTLLGNDPFCEDLALYVAMYRPADCSAMFKPLWQKVLSELDAMKENKIRYLSMVKGIFTTMQMKFAGIGSYVRTQVLDPDSLTFITVIEQTLNSYAFKLADMIHLEQVKSAKKDDIVYYSINRDPEFAPMAEDVQEILSLLENGDQWVSDRASRLVINEGIVNDAKEKAKAALVAKNKAERDFNELVMRKVKSAKEKRRNEKHAEIVGEALRINKILKKLMKSAVVGAVTFNAGWGVIAWVVQTVLERKSDKEDCRVLYQQLQDELEIVEEKIRIADSNSDSKAKIELMRLRQKLQHELQQVRPYVAVRVRGTGGMG